MKITPTAVDLNEQVAQKFFGWRWLAYFGRPTRAHPEYPKEMRVRRFFPPDTELGERWAEWFAHRPVSPANGDEPLCYCYSSSMGPHIVPDYTGDENAIREMERELHRRGLLKAYRKRLRGVFPSGKQRCEVALELVVEAKR